MPVVPFIIIAYILMACIVFFTFFTAKIAQMKLRTSAWGALGLVLGPIGMVIVSFLPSRRKDGKETNLFRSGFHALPNVSRTVFAALLILLAVVTLGVYLWEGIPKWKENREYENNVGTEVIKQLKFSGSLQGPVASVAAGKDSTYVITDKGDLYTWGYNDLALSMEDKGAAAENVITVGQVDRTTYILKKDGKLFSVNPDGQLTQIGENVKKFDCSDTFGAYVKTTGDVYVWGSNAYGQLSSADIKIDQPRWLCGSAKDVACGARHMLVLKEDGVVMGCGSNVSGALGLPEQPDQVAIKIIASNCKAIACGIDFSMILTNDNILKTCGDNAYGQLGRETEGDANRSFGQAQNGVAAIGAGGRFGWYIADDELFTWGDNQCGQLGRGNTENDSKPEKIMEKVTSVAASNDHLVILANNKIYCCGDNTYGQLGRLNETHFSPTSLVTIKK